MINLSVHRPREPGKAISKTKEVQSRKKVNEKASSVLQHPLETYNYSEH